MLSRLLRQILFTLIHIVVNVVIAVQDIYHRFLVRNDVLGSSKVSQDDKTMLLDYMPKLRKKLKHLVVIANFENHSLEDLARVIIWSLILEVPFVSLHDVTGQIKENEEKLFLNVEKKKKGIPGCIKWTERPNLNGYTNGSRAHTVFINIFTPDDGRPVIAQCVQQIANGTIPCRRDSGEFTANELDEALTCIYPSLPDPDLVLYTGTLCCTYGLLPWQIRLTEFIQLPKHSLSVDSYLNALSKYSKCEQRFGK